ncbi:MAG: DnaA regulatory inactivator Hda [Chromatiaceae bacterium]|nr:DnaA regulatory inactivator Hda [Gammaproteobacteria bacterium]MCP5303966.1 DnaA regulatory inactivator Hda [Chromatiaceae bacterium]MCP5313693.1 DnaA regulatory inactivator Hda [Chromatiaceae bacterium]
MIRQLPLALALRHAPDLRDFVAGPNQAILDALRRGLDGEREPLIYLFGASGSGRSHLLLGQCAAAQLRGLRCAYLPLAAREELATAMLDGLETLDLVAVDDVHAIAGDRPWEEALFALFNRCRDRGTRMLFSADRGPAALPLTLADLRSRLAWGLTIGLQPLDDAARHALLLALAARRALQVPDEVARYLLERGPRHPGGLVELLTRLDHDSLAAQRRLTIPFVRDRLQVGQSVD